MRGLDELFTELKQLKEQWERLEKASEEGGAPFLSDFISWSTIQGIVLAFDRLKIKGD